MFNITTTDNGVSIVKLYRKMYLYYENILMREDDIVANQLNDFDKYVCITSNGKYMAMGNINKVEIYSINTVDKYTVLHSEINKNKMLNRNPWYMSIDNPNKNEIHLIIFDSNGNLHVYNDKGIILHHVHVVEFNHDTTRILGYNSKAKTLYISIDKVGLVLVKYDGYKIVNWDISCYIRNNNILISKNNKYICMFNVHNRKIILCDINSQTTTLNIEYKSSVYSIDIDDINDCIIISTNKTINKHCIKTFKLLDYYHMNDNYLFSAKICRDGMVVYKNYEYSDDSDDENQEYYDEDNENNEDYGRNQGYYDEDKEEYIEYQSTYYENKEDYDENQKDYNNEEDYDEDKEDYDYDEDYDDILSTNNTEGKNDEVFYVPFNKFFRYQTIIGAALIKNNKTPHDKNKSTPFYNFTHDELYDDNLFKAIMHYV